MTWRIGLLATLVLTALSLGMSFAHLLEAPPRLVAWPPELWIEATVFGGQYRLFGAVGGPLDLGAVVATAVVAYLMRYEGPPFRWALAAALLYAAGLLAWIVIVAPANAVLATWSPGPVPADFTSVRNRWEGGHILIAALKLAGFAAFGWAMLNARRDA